MNQRAQYLIQILDKIGVPLLAAAEGAKGDSETATLVAGLLGKVVETSISMNQALDLTAIDAQDDSLRVALAALAGNLVADQYTQKGKMPEAADMARVQSAMSAVLTFADNFTLSDDHISRLEKLKADGGVVDAHQINIQYVDALIPVINAVGAFPFGQPEQKLIMDVSDRLVKRTAEMRETLLPGLSGDDEKLAELAILRATASVYASCHDAETRRLTGTDAEAPTALSIDPVWQAFEMRTAMLEAVARNIMPQAASGTIAPATAAPIPETVVAAPVAAAVAPPPPPVASPVTPPVETPPAPPPVAPVNQPPADAKPAIFQTKPVTETLVEPAAPIAPPPVVEQAPVAPPPPAQPPAAPVEAAAPAEQASGSGNPMAFFGSKPADTAPADDGAVAPPLAQQPAEVTPVAPVAPPVAVEQPVADAAPVAPPPVQTPAEPPAAPAPPPTAPPAESSGDDSDGDSNGGNAGGNPMAFFGKKD